MTLKIPTKESTQLKNVKVSEMVEYMKELEAKYSLYLNTYEHETRLRNNFLSLFSKLHNHIEIKSEWREATKKADCYAEVEAILEELIPDSREARIQQIIPSLSLEQFNKDKKKYFFWYDLVKSTTQAEFEKLAEEKTEKHLLLHVWGLKDNYGKSEFTHKILELIKILYDKDINIGDGYNKPLENIQNEINRQQNIFTIKLCLNGNVYLEFNDKELRNRLRDRLLKNLCNQFKQVKGNM
jgi:hypothetical protein